ncbi:DUF4344 domain-containing metallopeptidase [Vibrio chagasii]|nr:DUF4344 domain-containing metallopeptidase [Vibrio chagasii]
MGKEEDAVDNLATILLINYVEHGTNAAISAADHVRLRIRRPPYYYLLIW